MIIKGIKNDKNMHILSVKNMNIINFNNNLIKNFFSYCSTEDIINLSLVCKKFYEITKKLDYKFKEKCELNFCSDYNNL